MYNTVITRLWEGTSAMVRTVYADLLFLINFSMDFLCFFLVSRLFSRSISLPRVLLASTVGGLYAVFSLFLPFRGLLLLFCDASACAVMCLIAFLRRGISASRMMTEILIHMGISMALGGVMTAVYSLLNEAGISKLLKNDSDGISAWIFLLLAAVGGGATMLGSRFFRRNVEQRYFSVTVGLCGKERTFRATVDTGNALRDPTSGVPAAAVSVSALKGFLPPEICRTAQENPIKCFSSLPEEYRSRARLLPVRTVTGEGMLLAFRTDFSYIREMDTDMEDEKTLGERRELLIALTSAKPECADMLLPAGIS